MTVTRGTPRDTQLIENRTFDEISEGDTATLEKRLTMEDIKLFAVMSGDVNPAHVDEDFARSSRFNELIAHGMWGGALISTVLGTKLPGPGTIYLGQTLRFRGPVTLGDRVSVTVTVKEKLPEKGHIIFTCECLNQDGTVVLDGEARVLAPTEKISRPRKPMPSVRLAERGRLAEMLANGEHQAPVTAAVVHAVNAETLRSVVEAARLNLIEPYLVGPEARIREAAAKAEVDIEGYELINAQHSHAAAEGAAEIAASGDVQMIIKGALPRDEVLHAVMRRETGLRTERVPSHVMAFDVPTYPRPLLISDPQINIHPSLYDKCDIVRNAIDLAHALEIETPRVALLSSSETIDPNLPSTLDAAAVCKMADRGQIKGALLDGPMAFDVAISAASAQARHIDSQVAGRADILVAPDLEAASLLVKQLGHLADARGAGLLMGLRVPVVMSDRADDVPTRVTGIGLARRFLDYADESGRSELAMAMA